MRALIQHIDPVSFIKNASVVSIVTFLLWMGISLLSSKLTRGLNPMTLLGGGSGPAGIEMVIQVLAGTVGSVIGAAILVVLFNVVAGRTNGFPITFRDPVLWKSGRREVARIAPLSGLKVGAVIGAAMGLLFGLLAFVMMGAMMGLAGGMGGGMSSPGVPGVAMFAAMPVIYAVWIGLSTALSCLIYNWLASSWGGVRFETAPAQEGV